MKICKVCNKPTGYPHYVAKDGSITCEKCSLQNDIETLIPVVVDRIRKIDTWDRLNIIKDIANIVNDLGDQDIKMIDYIINNARNRE
jgi:hypothetical protein